MRRLLLVGLALPSLLICAPAPPQAAADDRSASAAATRYRAWVGGVPGTGDRRRERGQGAYHGLDFRVKPARRVRYRVCLNGPARRCWSRRTSARGRSHVNASLWLNDSGGPGKWQATWTVRGRRVAAWRFTISPEPH